MEDLRQLCLGVEHTRLGGVGDVDHAGADGMLVIRLGGGGDGHLAAGDQAVVMGEGQALVAGGLDRTGLMDVDVAGLGADHALVGQQQWVNSPLIGLGAADEEVHRALLAGEGFADGVCSLLAVVVGAVARGLFKVGGGQLLQDGRMAALQVIAVQTL